MVAAVDVAAAVATAVRHTRACAASPSGRFTDEVFPVDRRTKRAAPILEERTSELLLINDQVAQAHACERNVGGWVQKVLFIDTSLIFLYY